MPKVTIPGVGDVNFPDTMTPEQIQGAIEKDILPKAKTQAASVAAGPSAPARMMEPPNFMERQLAKLPDFPAAIGERGGAVGRLAMGAADPGVGIAQMAMNAMGAGDGVNKRVQQVEKQYQASREAQGSTGFDPLRLGSNVGLSLMAPVSRLAAPATMGKALLQGSAVGGAFGAAQPVTDGGGDFWKEKGQQTLFGAAGGAAGVPVSAALARLLRPNTAPASKALMDEGVNLTPGQILGGGFQRAEDAATSIPVLGDFIRDAKNRTLTDLNRAAYARALKPIGKDAEGLPVGPEGVAAVKKALSGAYDTLLPKLSFDVKTVTPELASLRQMAATLPKEEARQFNSILDKNLGQLSGGKADGETFKLIESSLGTEAKSFRGSTDGYQKKLGDALAEAQSILREGLTRSNPNHAVELKKINEGYANYARIRGAAASAGDKSSGFTPGQLAAAIRNQDKTAGKGATATGTALMQDLSDAARTVLPSTVADSGTPLRHAVGAGIAGIAGHSVLPGAGTAMATGAGLAALLTLPYTKLGQKAAQKILAERPEYAASLAAALRQGGPLLGAATLPALKE